MGLKHEMVQVAHCSLLPGMPMRGDLVPLRPVQRAAVAIRKGMAVGLPLCMRRRDHIEVITHPEVFIAMWMLNAEEMKVRIAYPHDYRPEFISHIAHAEMARLTGDKRLWAERADEAIALVMGSIQTSMNQTRYNAAIALAAELLAVAPHTLRAKIRTIKFANDTEEAEGLKYYLRADSSRVPSDVAKVADDVCRNMKSALAYIVKAQGALAKSQETLQTFPEIAEHLSQVRSEVSSLVPYGLCPYCKGLQSLRAQCSACGGQGWVTKLEYSDAPDELKQPGKVMINGDIVLAPKG